MIIFHGVYRFGEENMLSINRRLLVPLAMLSIVLGVGAVYAYTAITVTTTLTVNEPLTIGTVTGQNQLATISCTNSGNTATCTASLYAGESGIIDVPVTNHASVAITTTPAITCSDTDVTCTVTAATLAAASIGAGATVTLEFMVSVSPSATPTTGTTLTITVSR
jgi:hypothetical protein